MNTATQHKYTPSRHERLTELSMKLNALLCVTYGESGETFRRMADHIQDAYMWACSDIAHELKEVADSICEAGVEA